jgi:hypothetical protein
MTSVSSQLTSSKRQLVFILRKRAEFLHGAIESFIAAIISLTIVVNASNIMIFQLLEVIIVQLLDNLGLL